MPSAAQARRNRRAIHAGELANRKVDAELLDNHRLQTQQGMERTGTRLRLLGHKHSPIPQHTPDLGGDEAFVTV